MISHCPGTQKIRQPIPEVIKCLSCGGEVEIWTDEIRAVCQNCKTDVWRRQYVSCLDWCKYAKECIGEANYKDYLKNKKMMERHL